MKAEELYEMLKKVQNQRDISSTQIKRESLICWRDCLLTRNVTVIWYALADYHQGTGTRIKILSVRVFTGRRMWQNLAVVTVIFMFQKNGMKKRFLMNMFRREDPLR